MMNEMNEWLNDKSDERAEGKGLRGLGGTKMVIDIEYADLVIACKLCIDEVTKDNGAEFHTNLHYFLEGLQEDINFLADGEECGIVPKTTEDDE